MIDTKKLASTELIKKKYILVSINLSDVEDCFAFDTYDSSNAHNDNVFIEGIYELNDQEALEFNNRIAVDENICKKTNNDFIKVYRLIPEDQILNKDFPDDPIPRDLEIPEIAVMCCSIPNMQYILFKEKDKCFIALNLFSLQDMKDKLRITNHIKLDDTVIDNLERNDGLYYHKKMDSTIMHRHYVLFMVNLKDILSKITYEEFEKQITDQAYKTLIAYLKKYCDNDRSKMDQNQATVFFNDESFYWPGAVPVNG